MYKSFEELKTACLACQGCQLCQTRTKVVFGAGNPSADLMLIGEAPGEKEDLSGQPFMGRGGKLLDQMLESVGLSRSKNIYIANTVKCRPPMNKDPLKEDQEACLHWLKEEISFVKPKIIVCLGRISAARFINSKIKITKEHGLFFEKDGILFMGTLHPAAVLRNPNNKPLVLADFQTLIKKAKELGCNI